MLKKFNFVYIVLILSLLIATNMLILNEEILVLICFCFFVIIISIKLNSIITKELNQKSDKIYYSLDDSLHTIDNQLYATLKMYKSNYNLINQLNLLLKFCDYKLMYLFTKLTSNLNLIARNQFLKNIIFISNTEFEFEILIRIMLCIKLDNMIYLNLNQTNNLSYLKKQIIRDKLMNHERIIVI